MDTILHLRCVPLASRSEGMSRERSTLLTRILIGTCEILPRVDVRAAYDMYYRPFLLWAVIVGLFLKFAYVRYLTRLSWSRGAVADIAMNSASSLLNLIAVPMAFLVWTLPRLALNRVFGTDDTAPVGEMSGKANRELGEQPNRGSLEPLALSDCCTLVTQRRVTGFVVSVFQQDVVALAVCVHIQPQRKSGQDFWGFPEL